ncbi:Gag polyprotein [Gossypium australe]|uniref:Gag polyprotein n=1 Tax=Gossypium australe TaxID=47621 RepID=A0A5B6VWX8_9ROSI|nr:Gag polyprotein [Gossypium australe]
MKNRVKNKYLHLRKVDVWARTVLLGLLVREQKIRLYVTEKKQPIESTEYDIQVTNPLGQSVTVNLVCRKCPLKIKSCEFSTDLMLLPFREFDVVLGMD